MHYREMLHPVFVQCAFYNCKIIVFLFRLSCDTNQGFIRFSACCFEMASFGEADKPSISRLIKFSVNLCDRNDKLSDESRERLVFD